MASPSKSDPCQGMNNFFGSLMGGGAGLLGNGAGALGALTGQLGNMLGGGVMGNLINGALSGNLPGAVIGALGQFSGIPNLGGIATAALSGNLGGLAGAVSSGLPGLLNNLTGGALANLAGSLQGNIGGALASLTGQLPAAVQGELNSLLGAASNGGLRQFDPSRITALVDSPSFAQLSTPLQQDLQGLQSYHQGDTVAQLTDTLKQHLEALAARADYGALPQALRQFMGVLRADVEQPDSVVLDVDAFAAHVKSVLDGILALDPDDPNVTDGLRAALTQLLQDFVQSGLIQSLTNTATSTTPGAMGQMGGALQAVADAGSGAGGLGSLLGGVGGIQNVASLATSLSAMAGLQGLGNIGQLASTMAGLGGGVQGLMTSIQGIAAGGNIAGLLGGLPGGLGGAMQGLMSGNIAGAVQGLAGAAGGMAALAGAEKSALDGATQDLGAMAGSFNLPLLFAHPCAAGMMNALASDGLKNAMNPGSAPPARDDAQGNDPPPGVDAPLPPARPGDGGDLPANLDVPLPPARPDSLDSGGATLVTPGMINAAIPSAPAGAYTGVGAAVRNADGTPNGYFTPSGPRGV